LPATKRRRLLLSRPGRKKIAALVLAARRPNFTDEPSSRRIMKKYLVLLFLLVLCAFSAFAQDKIGDVKVSDDDAYVVLSTKRIQTMEKELEQAAAKGFRVLFGGPTQNYDVAIFLKRVTNPAGLFKYKILATSRIKTMEKEMNEAAQGGFRILPSTITFKQGFFTAELFLVMEREPTAANNYEYKLIEAGKEVNLQKKIEEAQGQGFEPVTLITLGKHVIILERVSKAKLAVRF
jgi:hypothetical protein